VAKFVRGNLSTDRIPALCPPWVRENDSSYTQGRTTPNIGYSMPNLIAIVLRHVQAPAGTRAPCGVRVKSRAVRVGFKNLDFLRLFTKKNK